MKVTKKTIEAAERALQIAHLHLHHARPHTQVTFDAARSKLEALKNAYAAQKAAK